MILHYRDNIINKLLVKAPLVLKRGNFIMIGSNMKVNHVHKFHLCFEDI